MTDQEILKLRKVLLVPDTLEEIERIVQLLWTTLRNNPWSISDFEYLANKFKNESIAIDISETGDCGWAKLQWFKKNPSYSSYNIIYLKSNKDMETRNITVTLEQAREWFNSGNPTLKTLALNAYPERLRLTYNTICDSMGTRNKHIELFIPIGSHIAASTNAKLAIIAAYFNGDWKMEMGNAGYFISKSLNINKYNSSPSVSVHRTVHYPGIVYFKNEKDALEAMKILGSEIDNLF